MDNLFSKIRFIVAVAAGKGGVGKSSLTVLLAEALEQAGYAVGVFDADLYGSSIGHMMPAKQSEDFWKPGLFGAIKTFSLTNKENKESAMHARAPVINALLLEAIHKIQWGDLDYLLVDFPPGTGDIQLTLLQNIPFSGVVLVTLPQEVSLLDVRKAALMFPSMAVPILGVIENMSYYQEGDGEKKYLFGEGGGKRLSVQLNVPLLEEIPIDPLLCQHLDSGKNLFIEKQSLVVQQKIDKITQTIQKKLCNLEEVLSLQGVRATSKNKWQMIWSDGKITNLDPHQLQKGCPCKACKEGNSSSFEDVEITSMTQVGKYAIQVSFSKGCSKGLFPLALLREDLL